MKANRWKVIAFGVGLSVAGMATCADDPTTKLNPPLPMNEETPRFLAAKDDKPSIPEIVLPEAPALEEKKEFILELPLSKPEEGKVGEVPNPAPPKSFTFQGDSSGYRIELKTPPKPYQGVISELPSVPPSSQALNPQEIPYANPREIPNVSAAELERQLRQNWQEPGVMIVDGKKYQGQRLDSQSKEPARIDQIILPEIPEVKPVQQAKSEDKPSSVLPDNLNPPPSLPLKDDRVHWGHVPPAVDSKNEPVIPTKFEEPPLKIEPETPKTDSSIKLSLPPMSATVKEETKRTLPVPGAESKPVELKPLPPVSAVQQPEPEKSINLDDRPIANKTVAPPPPSFNSLKLIVTLGDGEPRFEVRTIGTNQTLFKATVSSLEIGKLAPINRNSPLLLQKLLATGGVRFSGPDLEGECEELSILAGTGEVLLKGNVTLRTRSSKTWNTLSADKVVYQIGTEGLSETTGFPR